jgi:predicted metal-dependent phosphotriesterase family hydrolase
MIHPDGMESIVRGLRTAGVSQGDVDKITKRNPARFLGAK